MFSSSGKQQPIFFNHSFGRKKKLKWSFFEAEKLTLYLGSSLKLYLLCLLKPSILIWRTGVPASPFLPLSLSNTHGFPPHAFSFFFCHFHFTELREGFGCSKERKQNKNRSKRKCKNGKIRLWNFILWNGEPFHLQPKQTSIFFLLIDTRGMLLLTQDAPTLTTLVDLWTAGHWFGPERTLW